MWEDFLTYAAIGFIAQMVDGALGMAYGVTSTSFLLSAGVPPATASACVHTAEIFTTGASGFAHWRLGNVDRKLVLRLAIPGMIGGAIGAYILTTLPGDKLAPFINAYLFVLGLIILSKAWKRAPTIDVTPRGLAPLGFFGGFVDAIGGGGWGPIVTSTLLGNGMAARTTIGSVNLTEFFVTAAISAAFLVTVGLGLWPIIIALVVGGVIAAPFAAYATKYIPERALMIIVGCVIVGLSIRGLGRALLA